MGFFDRLKAGLIKTREKLAFQLPALIQKTAGNVAAVEISGMAAKMQIVALAALTGAQT